MDPLFSVSTIASTPNPQTVGFNALKSLSPDLKVRYENLTESEYGSLLVNTGVSAGHLRALNHSYIVLSVSGFPSYVLHSLTKHSTIAVCAQTERDLGIKIGQVAFTTVDVEDVFYFRQPGMYPDRYGSVFEYTEDSRNRDKFHASFFSTEYVKNLYAGYSEELASNMMPRNIRQSFVMSGSAMSLFKLITRYDRLHMSEEYGQMLSLTLKEMISWMPEVGSWVANLTKC